MARQVRISPDGNLIAIRNNDGVEAWKQWAVMHANWGGQWNDDDYVADWTPLEVPEPTPAEPEGQ